MVLVLFFCIDQNIYRAYISFMPEKKIYPQKWCVWVGGSTRKPKVKYLPQKASSMWFPVVEQKKQN